MAGLKNFYYGDISTNGLDDRFLLAMNFTPSEDYTALKVVVKGQRVGVFTSVTASLHFVDGNRFPIGGALAASTLLGEEISTDFAEVSFIFPTALPVAEGIEYAIVLSIEDAPPFVSFFNWRRDVIGGDTEFSSRFIFVGGGWDDLPANFWYEVWGGDIINPAPSDTATGITAVPLLQWEVADGGQEGDLFSVFLRERDSFITEDDLLRAGIAGLSFQIPSGLKNYVTYFWQVTATRDGVFLADSDIWSFTILPIFPPLPGVTIDSTGPLGIPNGTNGMVTLKRVVVAANNKIWAEFGAGPNVVSYLSMDDRDSDANPIDLGSAGMIWTKYNQAAQIVDGKIGKAFNFDGTADWLEVTTPSGLPMGSTSRTLTCWLRDKGSIGNVNTLINYGTAAATKRFLMNVDASGHLKMAVGGGNKTGTSTVLLDGEWHFVCVVLDATDGNQVSDIKFYVDGQPDAQSALTEQTIATENTFLTVGGQETSGFNPFNGDIDEVYIYDIALTPAQILELWNKV